MQVLLRTLTVAFLMLLIGGCVATRISTITEDRDLNLTEEEGYLFLSIRSDFSLGKFLLDGPTSLQLTHADKYDDQLFFIAKVEAGEYSLQEIASNSSRYRFDGDLWQFTVKPGVISYVGEMNIKQGSYGFSFFELINQSSSALEYMEHKYPNILASRDIEYWGPGEDTFFELVTKRKKVKVETPVATPTTTSEEQ